VVHIQPSLSGCKHLDATPRRFAACLPTSSKWRAHARACTAAKVMCLGAESERAPAGAPVAHARADLVDLGEGVLNEAQALIELLAHIQEVDEVVPLIALLLAKDLGFQDLGHRPGCRSHTPMCMILGPSSPRSCPSATQGYQQESLGRGAGSLEGA
jgi:hypothetical protein